jgi:hypothetical protein
LERGKGDRAARFLGQNLCDLGATALDDFGGLEEQPRALGWSRLRPRWNAFAAASTASVASGRPPAATRAYKPRS